MRSSNLRGIVAMILAVAAFSGMDTLLKIFSQHYPPLQVSTMRGAASLPFVIAIVAITGHCRDLRPVRFRMHLLRGVLMVATMAGFIYAVRVLSLGDAYAIFLSAPLFVTALSVPLLGEHVGWRRWIAIAVGMLGVIVILRPSASSVVTLGALAAMGAAVTYALNAITVRVLTRTDTTASVVFWSLLLLTVFSGSVAIWDWTPIRQEHWLLLAALGVLGVVGQHLLTEAFRSAPASVVAPFEYTALIWGITIDWVVWSVLPTSRIYIGGALVIGSGLYLIWRERRLSLAPPAPGSQATAG